MVLPNNNMDLQQRINAFVKLGKFLNQFASESYERQDDIPHKSFIVRNTNTFFTNKYPL